MNKNDVQKKLHHLSPSTIRQFLQCEAKWFFNKIMGLRTPASGLIVLGNAYDDALNFNFSQKIQTKYDLKTDILIDKYDQTFKQQQDDADFGKENKLEIKDQGRKLVQVHQETISPTVQPVECQQESRITFENVEWDFIMKPDLLTNKGVIIDNKTAGKSPSMDQMGCYVITPDYLIQMHSYGIGELESKKGIKGLMIHYAVRKKVPEIIRVPVPFPTKQDAKYFQNITSIAFKKMQMIRSNQTPPMPNRGHNNCSRKWCGYWNECEKMFGGTVKG